MHFRFVATMALMLAFICCFCACTHSTWINTGGYASGGFGRLEVYGTENVDFAYEEVGYVIAQGSRESVIAEFADQVFQLGADAVIDLEVTYGITGWASTTDYYALTSAGATNETGWRLVLAGVAVKKVKTNSETSSSFPTAN